MWPLEIYIQYLIKCIDFSIQVYEFHKREIPDDDEEKGKMVTTLMQFKVSLQQYRKAIAMDNVTM